MLESTEALVRSCLLSSLLRLKSLLVLISLARFSEFGSRIYHLPVIMPLKLIAPGDFVSDFTAMLSLPLIRNIYGTSLTWKAVRGTRVVWATLIGVTVAQFAITYLPPLQTLFATVAVPFWDGVLIVGVGVVLFAIIETEKQLRLRMRQIRSA